ncbi:MAG: putative phosphodiesterase [Planctomycetota bacterium]|jgi:predicted phosphodiesterase
MWIGVLADTCGEIHPRIPHIFQGMDYILHCGGIGAMGILEELSNLSPVTGVLGSTDDAADYPLGMTLFREDWGLPLLVSYNVGTPSRPNAETCLLLTEHDPKVLIYGHSGEPFNASVSDRLWFSPGSASRRDGKVPPSVGIIEIDGQTARGEIIPLQG